MMSLDQIIERYPNFSAEELYPYFPRMSHAEYPEFADYTWADCHAGNTGSGGLYLASDIAKQMRLESGMRVLELGAGHTAAAIFLANHYDVQVFAADNRVDPSENWTRVQDAGMVDRVIPLRMDARDILFPEGFFDAIISLNTYYYFGTDDLYLPYLLRFLRPRGRIGIGGPGYSHEITADTPQEFLETDSHAWHSPGWWTTHFSRTGLVNVLVSDVLPKGRDFWLDHTRWLLEQKPLDEQDDATHGKILNAIVMLMNDQDHFVTHQRLIAQKCESGETISTYRRAAQMA